MKVAFITGITGQDGSYIAELLLEKDYKVYGLVRRSSTCNTSRISHILDKITLLYGDLTDFGSLLNSLHQVNKHNPSVIEVYNLAAQSHVGISFEKPIHTAEVNAIGTLNLLETIRQLDINDKVRFYQASTSEMYGKVVEKPQNEKTPFYPRSPYAVSKVFAHWITKNYREAYNIFACNGILYNHEGSRRGSDFVTRKITMGIRDILEGKIEYFELGNLDALRDWGSAKDYVKVMWLMLQQENPDDYLIATGEQHSVREFVETAFKLVGYQIKWRGMGVYEEGYSDERVFVKINSLLYRPSEVDNLLGDASYVAKKLNWKASIGFDSLVKEMMLFDCANLLI